MTTYDVAIVSDLRFPGGTSSSIAEEVKAQAATGMRTALVHLPTAALRSDPPLNPKLEALVAGGMADLVEGEIHTRLAVIRHPGVLNVAPSPATTLHCDSAVIVANQVPGDLTTTPVYDPAVAHRNAAHWLGREPVWAPVSDQVRRELLAADALLPVLPWNWTNVIDVSEWGAPRDGLLGGAPVLGRHSRAQATKWPRDAETLRVVYPTDGSVRMRVLGGAEPVAKVLGEVPASWDVLPFGAMEPREFLAGIDFFVFYHADEMTEAFGRVVLEALASGAVAVVAPRFREIFGPACVYAEPAGVQPVIAALAVDQQRYAAQSHRGHAVVRARFSPRRHQQQVEAFLRAPAAPAVRSRLPATTPPRVLRPLFVCTNGAGVGHLTRVSAMARRASPWTKPVILTMCAATQIPAFAGVPVEHFPTPRHSGFDTRQWNERFKETLTHLMALHQTDAVVFDGPWPFKGLLQTRRAHPEVPFVWCRRGMAKAVADDLHARAELFDSVISPRDLGSIGRVEAVEDLPNALEVNPILLTDEIDVLDAVDAKRLLGLDPERPAVLVQLGAGNINDTAALHETVIAALEGLGGDHQICVTRSAISQAGLDHENVVTISHYPLSACYAAFDFGVSACGYNSFHEAIAFALPTLFIPNTSTSTDDQEKRAENAAALGIALFAHPEDDGAIAATIKSLADEHERRGIADACRSLFPGNGAADAMAHIEDLAAGVQR